MARTIIKVAKVGNLEGHRDAVYDFAISSRDGSVFSVGGDGSIVKWMPKQNEDGILVLRADQAFYSVFLDEETGLLYAGTVGGELFVINLDNAMLKSREKISDLPVYFIFRFEDQIYCGLGTGELIALNGWKVKLSDKALRSVCTVSGNLVIGGSDCSIHVLDRQLRVVLDRKIHDNSVFALEPLSKNQFLSSGRDAMIRKWQLKAAETELLAQVPAHLYQVKSLACNGSLILSSSMDKTIKIWDEDLNLLKVIDHKRNEGHTNCINKVKWLDDTLFVSSSDDRSLMVWQVEINS